MDADTVVCGHTHTQFVRSIGGKRIINSGSVGRPYEDAPGAYWTLDLEHRHTNYADEQPPRFGREEALSLLENRSVRD